MKKMGNHHSILKTLFFGLVLLLILPVSITAQEKVPAAPTTINAPAVVAPGTSPSAAAAPKGGDAVQGKALFNTNCAACHKLDGPLTGPALRHVSEKHEMAWIYKWVHGSSEMIKSGDPVAVKLFNENDKKVMTAFPQLSEADIDNIIAYTSEDKATAPPGQNNLTAGPPGTSGSEGAISNSVILGALTVILLILVIMLVMVNRVLTRIAANNDVSTVHKEAGMPIWKAFAKNQFLVLITTIFLMLAGAYVVYGYLMQIGVDQNYEPVQPIHYSHRIHAGSNAINCKYCHSSARVSKNAGIPSLNVCMNCHKNIAEVSDTTATATETKAYYDGEIQKLYNAVGWDKSAQKYTGKSHPVKWIRIHNLPDFVYFNHSQHVTVAGLECQTCHGPVETYEVMKQFAPLTMGWCINCHRKTEVKMAGNKYYDKIHDELAKKYGVDKLTAAQMGGLECGKCHY